MVKQMDAIQLNFALGLSMSCQGHRNLAAVSSRAGGSASEMLRFAYRHHVFGKCYCFEKTRPGKQPQKAIENGDLFRGFSH